jgi:hypothetical protein
VHYHLNRLAEDGHLTIDGFKSRTIVLNDKGAP